MILLCAHSDQIKNGLTLSYKNGKLKGLLDNFAGILVLYSAIFDDPSLIELEKKGQIGIFHNTGEEFGLLNNPPKVSRNDIVICVDVWCMDKKYDYSLDNIYGFSKKEISNLKESLNWERHSVLFRKFTNNQDEADESWLWRKNVSRCLTFSVPIEVKNNEWHGDDATISIERIIKCRQGLKRLICYLLQ